MRIRLLKSMILLGERIPIGKILRMSDHQAKRKIENKEAEKYSGAIPPKNKMKTNLFNPKK